jgi:hypothetical protein
MSFSILSLPVPLTASQQVYNTFVNNVDTASLEGRLLPVCILDGGILKSRLMQSSIGLIRGPINNTASTTLVVNVPTVISIVGSSLNTSSLNFDMPSNTALRYIGTDSPFNRVKISVQVNCYGTVAAQQMTFQLRKNGINMLGATQATFVAVGLITVNNVSIEAIDSCTTNDIFDVTVTNSTAANPVVIYNISICGVMNFS